GNVRGICQDSGPDHGRFPSVLRWSSCETFKNPMPFRVAQPAPLLPARQPYAVAAATGRGTALVGTVLAHRSHSPAAMAVTEIPAVSFPLDAPPLCHERALHLKSSHDCTCCCGEVSPVLGIACVSPWNEWICAACVQTALNYKSDRPAAPRSGTDSRSGTEQLLDIAARQLLTLDQCAGELPQRTLVPLQQQLRLLIGRLQQFIRFLPLHGVRLGPPGQVPLRAKAVGTGHMQGKARGHRQVAAWAAPGAGTQTVRSIHDCLGSPTGEQRAQPLFQRAPCEHGAVLGHVAGEAQRTVQARYDRDVGEPEHIVFATEDAERMSRLVISHALHLRGRKARGALDRKSAG